MSSRSLLRPWRWPRPGLPSEAAIGALLLLVVLAINGVAVWSILTTREDARRLALQELSLQTTAHARALEAALATLRGDFIFLSYSPPLSKAPAAIAGEDPTTRRWSRLAIEAALILFLEAHPPVTRVQVRTIPGGTLVSAGRREGMAVLLPPEPGPIPRERRTAGDGLVRVSWPLGAAGEEGGTLEATIESARLLSQVAPGLEDRLRLLPGAGGDGLADSEPSGQELVARASVADEAWTPPLRWTLERRETSDRMVRSLERLAGRYRTTVALNVAVMSLALALGLIAFRQVRRAARAEAESRHQARVHDLERQMRHSERLASVGRLSAGIAHEINNPLAGMRNYLALAEEDLAAGDAAGASRLLPRVREGLERIATIVRQVLRFGEPGRGPRGPVDFDALVLDALELVRTDDRFAAVELRSELRLGPDQPVEGDATTLGQLVLNLVLNACQAQPAAGAVTVSSARAGSAARLVVADRGPGFSAEALAHLFEPFFSTRGSTGLGLAVAHGIAVDHGGTIRGENLAGGGARLTVELPLHAAAEPLAGRAAARRAPREETAR